MKKLDSFASKYSRKALSVQIQTFKEISDDDVVLLNVCPVEHLCPRVLQTCLFLMDHGQTPSFQMFTENQNYANIY